MSFKKSLNELYNGDSSRAYQFRYALFLLDVVTVCFLLVSTFFYGSEILKLLDILFGAYMAVDYVARLLIAPKKIIFPFKPLNIADLIAILSLLIPLLSEHFAFFSGLRILRLLRTYRLQKRLREDFAYFRKFEDIIVSALHLFLFICFMTQIVFVTQVGINKDISKFLDAMYFTIATLTTTGFGDVTLVGSSGRFLSIVIMIFGVSLFLRLVQTIFRPAKVRYTCTECGLFLHESDAVHCKHCGDVLNIPSDGAV